MKNILKQLLVVREIRWFVGKLRFYYFTKLIRKLKISESKDAIDHTIKHNLKSLSNFGGVRMDKLIKPVSVLENISKDSKILVIGPRNEDDILSLIGHGFKSNNIIGLDLISYSPFIEVGDMHNTRFQDSFFDVVICGWTLSYSNEPHKFANELIRILKNNGVVAIGVEYSTLTEEQAVKVHGGYDLRPASFDRINSTIQIQNLFNGYVASIFFNHDAPNRISHTDQLAKDVSSVVTIFSIKKS
ncbi:MAG: methyltransferase domain-containing protein [Cyclobacteriaceae bacterium]